MFYILAKYSNAKIMSTAQLAQLIVIQPQGRLGLQIVMVLEERLNNLVSHLRNICVIDLDQIDFIDSRDLCILVTMLKVARRNHCRLVFCNVQTPIRLIFELTKLDSVFEIFESYEVILATFNASVSNA